MKSIERQILEVVMVMILVIGFIALCATSIVAQNRTTLFEIVKLNDEVECFAFYFEKKTNTIKRNIEEYRLKYSNELKDKGYNPINLETLIHYKVYFDKNKVINNVIEKKPVRIKEYHAVIGNHPEKVVFHYDIEE